MNLKYFWVPLATVVVAETATAEPHQPEVAAPAPSPEANFPPPAPAPPANPPPPSRFQPQPPSPRGNTASWVTNNDYPPTARAERREGITGFRLIVDPRGRVSTCFITASSGFADLDQATCDLLSSRARFHPARDGDGERVSGSFSSRVSWRLPAVVPEPPSLNRNK